MTIADWKITTMLLVGAAMLSIHGAEIIANQTAAAFKANSEYLTRITNPAADAAIPAAEQTKILNTANQVVDGVVFFYDREPITVGKSSIDWFGSQRDHQEWIAQLNRFRMLDVLGKAYRLSGDEKYPQRARELIADFQYFLEELHQYRFFDAQNNNKLNLAIRIGYWTQALQEMGDSQSFDDAFVASMCKTLARQLDSLLEVTTPGISNWNMAQADALMMASLMLAELPGSQKRLRAGLEIFAQSAQMQFRPDGSHLENCSSYQHWVTELAGKYRQIGKKNPSVDIGLSDDIFHKSLVFCMLASPFAFNDSPLPGDFPVFAPDRNGYMELAKKIGLDNWKMEVCRSFPDAGLELGGNGQEAFFFDATSDANGHQHHSRLNFLYAINGVTIIADPGITSYEKSSPFYRCGRESATHATVQPDDFNQFNRAGSAQDHTIVNSPEFAVLNGIYTGGYAPWAITGQAHGQPVNRTVHQRHVVWLPGEYLLLSDQLSGEDVTKAEVWNIHFPFPDQEKIHTDPATLKLTTENGEHQPNFTLQLLPPENSRTKMEIYRGQKQPNYRGWRGNLTGGIEMPLLEFAVANLTDGQKIHTLLSAAPSGSAPELHLKRNASGNVTIIRADGSTDEWLDHAPMTVDGVTITAQQLMIRRDANGNILQCFGGKITRISTPAAARTFESPFTGWFDLKK